MPIDKFFELDHESVLKLAELGYYDFIIVGSGFGGGVLASELARYGLDHPGCQKRVLLIERGCSRFSSHFNNSPRPDFSRGRNDSPEGNETLYHQAKGLVQVVEDSDPYVGGPLYALGGRSLVWGLNIPRINPVTLREEFHADVVNDLDDIYYKKAFSKLTNGSQEREIYPMGHLHGLAMDELTQTTAQLSEALKDNLVEGDKVELMPTGTEFVPRRAFRFAMGAYSTAPELLNHIYGKDSCLTALLETEVLDLDLEKPTDNGKPGRVKYIKIRHISTKKVYQIPAGGATVILSAGSICTARIALNSGLQRSLPLVGKGLMDHPIFDSRFVRRTTKKCEPMNLRALVNVCGTVGLMTVTVNNDFFLSGSANSPTDQYLDVDGSLLPNEDAYETVEHSEETYDSIAVVLEFGAPLCDTNEVLLHASSDPVIRVRRRRTYTDEASQKELQELVTKVRDHVVDDWCNLETTEDENEDSLPIGIPPPFELAPRMTLRGFGLVAHEVGTMRMDSPAHPNGVVDTDLKVHGYDNLYVCDLSVFPYSPPANPALTLSALSLRLADHLLSAPSDLGLRWLSV